MEDGHLTLGKALTAPRFTGHAAGAETPRAESLVVHYDTTVDSVVSGTTVVDISGQGNNGTFNGNASYSSTDRSLNLDATGDSIYIGNIGNQAGAWVHSVSFWIYFLDLTSDRVFEVTGNTQDKIPHFVLESDGDVRWDFYASNIKTTSQPIAPGIWYHVALSYNGGVHGLTNSKIYINGVSSASEDNGSGNALNIDANEDFYIGAGTKQRISNFKIWGGVALTAEEVAMEYALGRTGKSLNLTDTSLCLGGTVPRAQLDVRGVVNAETFYGLNDATVAYKFFDTDTTLYTFSGLNLRAGEAYKIIWHYHNTTPNHNVHMFVNGDETDSNYWHAIQQVTSSFASAGSTGRTAKMFSTGNSSDHIWVYDLRLSHDRRPMMMGHGHFSTPTSNMSTSSNQSWRLGTWYHNNQTSAITSLKFDPTSSGAFGAGSYIRILKMM